MPIKKQILADEIKATTQKLDDACTPLLQQVNGQMDEMEASWPSTENKLNASYSAYTSDMNKDLAGYLVKTEHILSDQE